MNADRLLEHFDRLCEAPDAIPKFRQLVLNLAVRGALVAQDSQDQSAESLLGDRAVHAVGVGTPFELPHGWAWSSFERLGETIGGGTPSKTVPEYWNGDIPWVSPKDMKVDRLRDAEDHITNDAIENSSTRLVPSGSLLVVVRGMILIHSFPSAICEVPVTINQDMKAIKPFRPDVAPFLHLITKGMKPEILSLVDRSTHGTCKLLTNKLFPMLVPIAPLPEQRRIVAKVNELMELCDRLEAAQAERERCRDRLAAASLARLNRPSDDHDEFHRHVRFHLDHFECFTTRTELIPALREMVLGLATDGYLVGQEPSDESIDQTIRRRLRAGGNAKVRRSVPDDVVAPASVLESPLPSGWVLASTAKLLQMGVLVDLKDGNHGANHPKVSDFTDDGLPFITAAQVDDEGNIDYESAYKISGKPLARLRVGFAEPGDVIYTHKGSVGRVALCDRECILTPQTTYYRPDGKVLLNRYLKVYLRSPAFRSQVDAVKKQTTRDFVSIKAQYNFFVRLPPVAEQDRIVTKVEALMAICDELERRLAAVETDREHLLRAVLYEALSAKAAESVEVQEFRQLTLVALRFAARFPNWRTGGDRKRMVKSLAIAQRHLGVEFGWSDNQKSAGPHNGALLETIEAEATAAGLLEVEPRTGDLGVYYRYKPKPLPTAAAKQLAEHFGDKLDELNRLADLTSTWTSEQAELYATIYAVWNDLLIDKKPATDSAVVSGVRKWSTEKAVKFSSHDVEQGIAKLRELRLIPQGLGPRTRTDVQGRLDGFVDE